MLKRSRLLTIESSGPDYIFKNKSGAYGKNPDGCSVLHPPDIECNRSNSKLFKSKRDLKVKGDK